MKWPTPHFQEFPHCNPHWKQPWCGVTGWTNFSAIFLFLLSFLHDLATIGTVAGVSDNFLIFWTALIPHICPFWYTTILFRPVNYTKKCVNLEQNFFATKQRKWKFGVFWSIWCFFCIFGVFFGVFGVLLCVHAFCLVYLVFGLVYLAYFHH